MFRSINTGNKTIYQKTVDKNYSMHLERLKKIRNSSSQTSQLQNQNSELIKSALYLRSHNKKRELQNEVEFIKIDRENKILLDKMAKIVSHGSNPSKQQQLNDKGLNIIGGSVTNRSGGGNTQKGDLSHTRTKSLNEYIRKKEVAKITVENQGIINRLRQQSSFYDVEKWEKEYRIKETYLRNICEYPLNNRPNTFRQERPRRESFNNIKTCESPTRRSSVGKIKHLLPLPRSLSVSTLAIPNRNSKKLVLCTKEADIHEKSYLVEFSTIDR